MTEARLAALPPWLCDDAEDLRADDLQADALRVDLSQVGVAPPPAAQIPPSPDPATQSRRAEQPQPRPHDIQHRDIQHHDDQSHGAQADDPRAHDVPAPDAPPMYARTAKPHTGPTGPTAAPAGSAGPAARPCGTVDLAVPHTAGPDLDQVALLRKARRPPARGWRRAVHSLTAGAINPGESAAELEYQELLDRVRRPVRGDYRIAVLSLKGGVGKTTTVVGLGSTFASLRGDRVVAVDANPDLGTLAQRIPLQTESTVRDLLADPAIHRYSDVRAHTSQAPSRLEVLASERDPAAAEAFSEDEYRGVIGLLQRYYNIILTDCGTGLSHDAMRGVLDLSDALILVSSPALDGARSAGATLDWLAGHGFGHLIGRCVVVLSSSRPGSSSIDTDQLAQHFLARCRAVLSVGFDDHLAEGADIDLELLSRQTRRSFVELAAIIADDFGGTAARRHPPRYPE